LRDVCGELDANATAWMVPLCCGVSMRVTVVDSAVDVGR